ncbi:MAG: methionine--tRNA ligase [Candidatus Ryanbacteria bacterium CG10_big_fil_rev_8_21_14_0_10_43_42]|uniref:Methionine--tRNA ligase n=1 Tax=Candidatus Ryanbacteria bacterium CG10_big_fil_rev_8_21_14_0_10_43_42 TaxID=1974864 RepID=A0A2M8KXY9_9BACT|nr:MAG: methionine--tRNA ligase [Candidatus Ryanbacteria bacterium CG10_big_fil_rev_8_21_14_0_10_43_42]
MSKFYITTSIAYVNAPPHVGYAMELLQADTIARYRRLQGDDVFFLTGTDEHGAKIARAAESAGKSPKEFVDEHASLFTALADKVHASHTAYIRTSDQERHWPGAQELWRRLEKAGDIYKASYRGLYCVGHEAFITEKDLVDGVCQDHGKEPEDVEEENYFFRLSRYTGEIKKRIKSGELEIIPSFRKNEMLTFLNEGLEDVSFSRPAKDISWGVPVPGDNTQTMYVWCDALSNYITALGFGENNTKQLETYWPCDMHVIGKDILRFHALIWPGMLLSAGIALPKRVMAHGFINSGGKKMSKSLGNVIDPFSFIDKYGVDSLRYFLLREIPTFEDGDFTEDRFTEAYNAHLANGLGNVVSRVTKMVEAYFEGYLAKPADDLLTTAPLVSDIAFIHAKGEHLSVEGTSLLYEVERSILPLYHEHMQTYRLNEAMNIVWGIIHMMDKYIQTYEPFKLIKTDKEKTQVVLWQLLRGIDTVAYALLPFMPQTSASIRAMLGVDKEGIPSDQNEYTIKEREQMFPRIG